jgi:hypothetical protein
MLTLGCDIDLSVDIVAGSFDASSTIIISIFGYVCNNADSNASSKKSPSL